MSSSLDMKFTGDAAQIERTFEKMKKMQQDLLTLSQRISQESRATANQEKNNLDQMKSSQDGVIAGLEKIALSYYTVNQAVQAITESYKMMVQKQREAAKHAIETNELVLKAAGSTGDLKNADKISQYAEDAANKRLAPKNISMGVYEKIARAAPELDFEKKIALSQSVLPQLPTLSNEETPVFAELVGNLGGYYGKDKTADQIVALAKQVRTAAGDKLPNLNADKLQLGMNKLVESGAFTKDEALAQAVSTALADLPAGTLGDLADKLTQKGEIKKPTASSPLSLDDRRRNAIARVNDPRQRLEMLRRDPELARAYLGDAAVGLQFATNNLAQLDGKITAGQNDATAFNKKQIDEALKQEVVSQKKAELGRLAGQDTAKSVNEKTGTINTRFADFYNEQLEKNLPGILNAPRRYAKSLDPGTPLFNAELSGKSTFEMLRESLDAGVRAGEINKTEADKFYETEKGVYEAQQRRAGEQIQTGLQEFNNNIPELVNTLRKLDENLGRMFGVSLLNTPKPVNVNVRGDVEGR